MLRGGGLVEPPHRRRVGGGARDLGILARLAQDRGDRLGEGVERLARLGLGRLDHQRLLDEQREVHRRRVIAEVEQPLGEVERLDLELALHRRRRRARTRACRARRRPAAGTRRRRLPQPREQVVGVQHGGLGGVAQAVGAERADVGVGAYEAAVVALEAAQAADRARAAVVVEVERRRSAVSRPRRSRRTTTGRRQERRDALGHGDRSGARAAAAVRLGEGLVEVEVDDVEAHVAGPGDPHHRVEVGAVVVERRADPVHDPRDLLDVGVEQAERVRVGQHQAGDVGVGLRAQVVEVDAAVGRRSPTLTTSKPAIVTVAGLVPWAVSGVSTLWRGLAAVLVVGAGQQHARELAVGARRRLQRDVRQAGDLRQRSLQAPHQLERPLRARRVLQRVQPGVTGQRRDALVQAWVVLHRAGAERVEAGVEVEVALGDAHVVAHDLGLGDLGQPRRRAPAQRAGISRSSGHLGHVERRRTRTRGVPARRCSKIVSVSACGASIGDGARCTPTAPPCPRPLMPTPPPARRRPAPRPAPRRAGRCPPASAAR